MHNPPTGMDTKGSSKMNREEEMDPLAISERKWVGKKRERAEPLIFWFIVISFTEMGNSRRDVWK